MISFDEAVAIIANASQPLGVETVALGEAAGRVLAAPVVAAIDSPRANVSAMDGYAVRGADLGTYPVSLKIVGESFPGAAWERTVEEGQCVRIFTGAPIPGDADRIVIQERVRRDGDAIAIEADPGPATWVRPRGKDFRAGDILLEAGRLLDPAALIAAAGADVAEVEIHSRPRVALLSNGDELVEPGEARHTPLAVPDSASIGVAALAERWGADIVRCVRLRDDLASMESAAAQAVADADLVVVIGGASVGDHDFAKAIVEPLGLEILFAKVSMRPGKPAWFGHIGDKLILGLPGNPTSALVTGRLLLSTLLCALQGRSPAEALTWQPAQLASPLAACDARETFHRATFHDGKVELIGFQESHAQKALAEAEILVRQAANSPASAVGEMVDVLRL